MSPIDRPAALAHRRRQALTKLFEAGAKPVEPEYRGAYRQWRLQLAEDQYQTGFKPTQARAAMR